MAEKGSIGARERSVAKGVVFPHHSTTPGLQHSRGLSSFPAGADVIVKVQQVEPGRDVLAVLGNFRMEFVEEGARFGVSRSTLFLHCRPGQNKSLVWFGFGGGIDPLEDFPIAFAGGDLLFERFGFDAGKLEQALVHGAGVIVFAILSGDGRATFVEHAGQDHVAAQPHARTAGRSFG